MTPIMLEELAVAYVARFATSAKALERYCRRKLRERGWEGQEEGTPAPDVAALVSRFVEKRYVDDEEFARLRTGSLLRRGYGARRVGAALDQAGIAGEDRHDISQADRRHAALRMAEKRRFGPFGADGAPADDRAVREKQIAAMIRAGHSLDAARELVDAPDQDTARDWAHALDEEEYR
ncbi:regulatory protein RecX [Croceicoccus pelagius]|nr:RecX family transcriptional regulator [Croceicoccus pelagius]